MWQISFQTHGEHACTLPIIKVCGIIGSLLLKRQKELVHLFCLTIGKDLIVGMNYLFGLTTRGGTGSDSSNDVETQTSSAQSDVFSFNDYIDTYKKEHPNENQDENLLRASVDFLYETVDGADGLLEVFSRTGGYSKYANNKLKNGKFAQVRWGKSDRKEGKLTAILLICIY